MSKGTIERGHQIETRVSQWLNGQGLALVERNFARRFGEIDLIMQEPESGVIVFVEVRYRNSDVYGGGLESVDTRKQSKLLRTAAAWLQKHGDERTSARFDVVAVSPDNGKPPPDPLSCDPPIVSWQGLNILWIRDALQTT